MSVQVSPDSVEAVLRDVIAGVGTEYSVAEERVLAWPGVEQLIALTGHERTLALLTVFKCLGDVARRFDDWPRRDRGWLNIHGHKEFCTLAVIARLMLRRQPGLSHHDWGRVLAELAEFPAITVNRGHEYLKLLLPHLERELDRNQSLTDLTIQSIERIAKALRALGRAEDERSSDRFLALLSRAPPLVLDRGEAWSERAIADVEAAPPAQKLAWAEMLSHAEHATGSTPSGKWSRQSVEVLGMIGREEFARRMLAWLPLVDRPRTAPGPDRHRNHELLIVERHMDVLKGLCWIAGTIENAELARALGRLALSAYRKVPGIGPRAVRVGNAAVYALGQMPGIDSLGQLAMLRVKVKFGTAQKGIEKALAAAAERQGLPRDEIEELGVPSYGLTEVGRRTEQMGDYTAELLVTGIGSTELRFVKPPADGKPAKAQKSVPAAVKEQHADELKELKAAAKDIGAMLPAQRNRIDSLFLENRSWGYAVWRERYLDHPLVGVVARRLIWTVADGKGDTRRSVAWLGGEVSGQGGLVGADGGPATVDGASAIVRLWHPVEAPGGREEIMAWRRFFEDRHIRQPFKQAHREVYLLTDAERRTETYSNRYAAHIIRQHQFNALCGARSWKNRLRLMVDDEYPPATRALPAWGLRAEFWVEGVGDDYGVHTNETGVFHLLTTDQVRFYRETAAQMTAHAYGGGYGAGWRAGDPGAGVRLEEIPPLVFSEVMRDVDLFVGVCSVGNNPQWNDGGPGGVHRDYWWDYSFGALSETGAGRKELLERLVPRLKIAPVCSFEDKFLIVRGNVRTYAIHLGSGNILMRPEGQYLCIVPSSRDEPSPGLAAGKEGGFFLPFEGDRTLSIILSKAFMLAEDDKIKDPSIMRQIKG